MTNNLPKVQIDTTDLHENRFVDDSRSWDAATLIQYCKDKGYEPFETPLVSLDLSGMPWKIGRLSSFINHMHRVMNTDLSYPIILDDEGCIADGWHRVVKAIIEGQTTIKCIRLNEMPRPSGYENKD